MEEEFKRAGFGIISAINHWSLPVTSGDKK